MRTIEKAPVPMTRQTGALLVCGVVAGPIYVAVTAIQALRGWAWFSLLAVPISLAAFALVGAVGADTATKYLAFLIPGILMWVWITALALHLYRRTDLHR